MKKYSHENWNQVLALPDSRLKQEMLKEIGQMAKGNLHWFVRKLIATEADLLIAEQHPMWVESGYWQLLEPTEFTKQRRKMEKE